jgi:hypothetical protein
MPVGTGFVKARFYSVHGVRPWADHSAGSRRITGRLRPYVYGALVLLHASVLMRRFGFDAAILFSDILVVPHALGQHVSFEAGEGPRLAPPIGADGLETIARTIDVGALAPVFETIRIVRSCGRYLGLYRPANGQRSRDWSRPGELCSVARIFVVSRQELIVASTGGRSMKRGQRFHNLFANDDCGAPAGTAQLLRKSLSILLH